MRATPPPPVAMASTAASHFLLGSNNDQLEHAQEPAAARAAALRHDAATFASPPPRDPTCLSQDQIMELFQKCIKLASENKINEKNTWELKLIDHLGEISKVERGGVDAEPNFQKASCILEAGVRIYSVRVDSVHSHAYKLLARINRAGLQDSEKPNIESEIVNSQQDESQSKEESEKNISPLSTLEYSLEALNMKKFDFAFAADPLYHWTHAQYDESGAKGLLLNNLGVYGGCQVLFDSFEVPGKCHSCSHQNDISDEIDISFAKDSIEHMMMNMMKENEISPTLKDILCYLDGDNQRSSEILNAYEKSDATTDGIDTSKVEMDNFSWTSNLVDEMNIFEETLCCDSSSSHSEFIVDQGLENVSMFLLREFGINSKKNIWAGPDHWKIRKCKSREDVPVAESGSTFKTKRQKNQNQAEVDVVFRISSEEEPVDIFAPPKSLKNLLLPENRAPLSTTLPEDCHYEPLNLLKLFLLPNVLCLGKKRRELQGSICQRQSNDFDAAFSSWDNESVLSSQQNDRYFQVVEETDEAVSKPSQVGKIEVQYENTIKQVDVHALKQTLWDRIQESSEAPETGRPDIVSFKHVLAAFPDECRSTTTADVSLHLWFFCLLHLANEHGLTIQDCPSLDDLTIHLPSVWQNAEGMA
ncbi:condensin complex subunit 2-like [Mercurialis annua]|uniref:condensin complex subunit 2-like n=1 Tax=Mercurialis annua TaxID=3986 RepID=UPI00215E9E22|nr:condensin complex subunit 2-like [Mercurialis annua]